MFLILHAALVAQAVKNLLPMQETPVQPPGQEDPLEKGLTTHSNILTWESPRTGRLAGYSPRGCKESDTIEQLTTSLLLHAF